MTNNDGDQDWLDALAGKPGAAAEPDVVRRATVLRHAIRRHNAAIGATEFDTEAGLQKLKFHLRREGLNGTHHQTTLNKRYIHFAMAASVILTVGVMMRIYLQQVPMQNEAEIMRGMGERQLVLAANPEERLKQLTTELDRLAIKYQIERKEGKIILKIQGIDPAKGDVASFLERNYIKPPVRMDVELEIRLSAK